MTAVFEFLFWLSIIPLCLFSYISLVTGIKILLMPKHIYKECQEGKRDLLDELWGK